MTARALLKPHTEQPNKRKKSIVVASVLFILMAIGYCLYWYLVLCHYQTTNDAYVVGNQVNVMAQVAGSVSKIYAENTQRVNKGDILLELEPTDEQVSFIYAQNMLASAVRQTQQKIVDQNRLRAKVRLKQLALRKAESDFKRRANLADRGAIDKETLQHAKMQMQMAQAELDVVREQLRAGDALLLDTPLPQQPAIQQSASRLREAWLSLQRTKIVAPAAGYVSRRNVQIGARVNKGSSLMAIIPEEQLWVDANFKETQIRDMRIGQAVRLVSDVYGDKVIYQGKIVGLDMGTGSAFSLLPVQNATGNWIKVVQRVPVRIDLEPNQLKRYPLRIGLSMTATVDITDNAGPALAVRSDEQIRYQTETLSYEQAPINELISQIIARNVQAGG
ncbi:HlyD family efflux transporter periplasmic adaptor subunit [Brenneria rubrifaciens]|uniref:HlyD family efflux transporter periplasmic adaptor subunit n=1 Tax=Brenneria rubrifaciens TaxID=55213 RepID=A0A4P8QMZ0_9GAMM|nr:HlyD family efflux transporter periplasmic adaptor subunit [Brenneria rubrifaciens]QCR08377.1 HlyD family efflux transporter periplasmic adaptor subunit [Brenneria rubrifaciens]